MLVWADNAGGSETTDPNGFYRLWVPAGWSGTGTPSRAGYSFIPPAREYTDVYAPQSAQDFVASAVADLNCDGLIDFDDIDPFVLALSDRPAYEAQYASCNWYNADCNADGYVDFADIDAFVALLAG